MSIPGIKKKCKYRFMLPEEEQGCIGIHCEHLQRVEGKDPQNNKPVEEYICSDLLDNILKIENTRYQIVTAASVQSFRNVMIQLNGAEPQDFDVEFNLIESVRAVTKALDAPSEEEES